VAKKTKKSKSAGGVKYRSAVTGRYVKASPEAAEFSRQFNKKYRSTLRDLSKK
jgi:hypothetical protein